ncbi:MAG: family 43 glycosylhydrolase [Candidatus Sumerlaeia bacterium]
MIISGMMLLVPFKSCELPLRVLILFVLCMFAPDLPCFAESLCPPGVPRSIEPLFDHPLRDTSICKGPDGIYYLTGTAATANDSKETGPANWGFENNDGVWLWKSKDLKNWEEVGQVWSISRDPVRFGNPHFRNPSSWQLYWRASMESGRRVRGMTSPEIHYICNNFYIAYSMNGYGSGLLQSEKGKAEGPYRDLGKIARFGGDPSMFEDTDGTVYWVWGEGWIAKMKEDLTGLAEEPRLMKIRPEQEGGSWPLRIGTGGAYVFKVEVPEWEDGPYHLVGYEYIARMGPELCCDTFIASAESVYGPYKRRDLLVPHGGQSVVFQGSDNQYYATFSGMDEWAAFRDKPGIVPLVSHATEFGADYWWCGAFTKPWYPVTEGGAWGEIDPFVTQGTLRDVSVLNAPDGYYYMTCTDMELNKKNNRAPREKIGVQVWRSRDMEEWEDMGVIWKCDEAKKSRQGLDKTISLNRFGPILYDIEMHYMKDTFWIVGSMQTGKHWADKDGCLILILRSESGKAEGPYEFMWQDEHDCNLWTPSLLEDDDGKVYIVGGGIGNTVGEMRDDMTGLEGSWWKIYPRDQHKIGEGGHLLKIAEKYIHTSAVWHGADPYDKGMSRRGRLFSTYDLMYFTADDLKGPWSETRCAAPKCGNARPFQDKNGNWFAPFFGNHYMGPWKALPGAYPIRVRQEKDDVFLEALR